jgi:hypothetical protein
MATLGFLAIGVVFGIGLVILVVALVVALIDNRVNYGRWRRGKAQKDVGSPPPPE